VALAGAIRVLAGVARRRRRVARLRRWSALRLGRGWAHRRGRLRRPGASDLREPRHRAGGVRGVARRSRQARRL